VIFRRITQKIGLGAHHNTQIVTTVIVQNGTAEEHLNRALEQISADRTFLSDEAKAEYLSLARATMRAIAQDDYLRRYSRFVIVPFQELSNPSLMIDATFLHCLMDAIAVVKLLDPNTQLQENYVNLALNNQARHGMYYFSGNSSLGEALIRFLREVRKHSIQLPAGFTCFMLNASGEHSLSSESIKRVVTDIAANDSEYIKFGPNLVRCINLTSNLITDCADAAAAAQRVREFSNVD